MLKFLRGVLHAQLITKGFYCSPYNNFTLPSKLWNGLMLYGWGPLYNK